LGTLSGFGRAGNGWEGLEKSTGIFHPFVGTTHLSADYPFSTPSNRVNFASSTSNNTKQ